MRKKWSVIISLAAAALMFAAIAASVAGAGWQYSERTKERASAMLEAYRSNVNGTLDYQYNYAIRLRDVLYASNYDYQYLGVSAEKMLGEEVAYIAVTDESHVIDVYASAGALAAGQRIEDLDYSYQLARLNAQAVREGPVDDVICGKKVFLIIEPIFRDGKWCGQIAAAIAEEAVYKSFHLETLRESGYEYLFWRIHNGQKENLITSNASADFTSAREIRFEMPTAYTLSILPVDGWGAGFDYTQKYLYAALIAVLGGACVYFVLRTIRYRKRLENSTVRDSETRVPNRIGLLDSLDREFASGMREVSLIYCMMHNLSDLLLAADENERKPYIEFIVGVFESYVQSPHITARITSDSFAVAVRQKLSVSELEDIGRGLAIELFRKIEVGRIGRFPVLEFGYAVAEEGHETGAALLRRAVDDYEKRRSALSPAVDLKKRCDAMIEGSVEVTRPEYADPDMNELAKSVFRYYRKSRKNK